MTIALSMLIALLLEAAFEWPGQIYRRIGHPIVWLGHLIGWLDRRLNRGQSFLVLRGAVAVAIVVGVSAVCGWLSARALPEGVIGVVLTGIVAWPLVASRSLHRHVVAVVAPLAQADIPAARTAISMIVGRDPKAMDAPAIARAALESLAENTSDGVVAPLFWGVLLGLPGIAAYKAINTLDSMIGYRNERYEQFGKVAARLDDLANIAPARLTGFVYALASGRALTVGRAMWREARWHRSPNAGWPEAAMANAIGCRLSGPRIYHGQVSGDPWLNSEAPDPGANDVLLGLKLFRRVVVFCGCGLAMLAVI